MNNIEWGSIYQFGKTTRHFVNRAFKIHFFTYKSESPDGLSGYQSVALEFGFFAYGETPEKSEQNLFSQVDEFAKSVKTNAEFIAAIENLNLENFWDTYRKITFLVGDPERLHYEKIEEENKELKQSNIDKEEEIFSLKIDLDTLNKKFNEIKIPS